MFWLNVRRVLRTGLLQVTRNGFVSFASAAVMVVALGVVAAVALGGGMLRTSLATIEEKVDINVYLTTAATDEQIESLRASVAALPEVANVEVLTADARLARFRERNANDQPTLDVLAELEANPLGAALLVKAKEPSQYAGVAKYLEQNHPAGQPGSVVSDVNYFRNKAVIDRLTQIIDAADRLGVILASALILVAILVTLNTLRLAIYTSRDEISIMRLVGADGSYVTGPFLVAGAAYGLIAAVITLVVLFPVCYWLGPITEKFFGETSVFEYLLHNLGSLTLMLVGAGVLVGAVSSLIAVHRYIRAR